MTVRLRTRRHLRWHAEGTGATRGFADPASVRAYAASIVATAVSTLTAWALTPWVALDSLVMIYLVGVVVVAARCGRGPATLAAVGGSVAFDFFLVPPVFSLRISEPRLAITVGVMLLVGLVISALTAALRDRGRAALEHARRVAVLYSLTRNLGRVADDDQILQVARRQIGRAIASEVEFRRQVPGGDAQSVQTTSRVVDWVVQHRRRAGRGTTQYPDADATYLPLVAGDRWLGLMIVRPLLPAARLGAAHTRFLANCARQVAGALERERLVRAAHASERAAVEEQLRSSLLASVSHDLRQPLTLIESAAASLLEGPAAPANPIYAERVRILVAETRQMTDTLNKILDATRLESAPVQLDRQWYPLETLILGALNRVRGCLAEHVVVTDIPSALLWVYVDGLLFEKLLTNLLENAAKFSNAGSVVTLSAAARDEAIEIRVSDEGCGLPPGDTDRIFRKFHRGTSGNAVPGIGLGLSICRAVVELHGGLITALHRPAAGSEFVVRLPVGPGAPAAQTESEISSAPCEETA